MTAHPVAEAAGIPTLVVRRRTRVNGAVARWRAEQRLRACQREAVRHERRDRTDRYLDGVDSVGLLTTTVAAFYQR